MTSRRNALGAVFGLVLVLGCSPRGPKDIRLGEELCDHCHMTIVDPAFAGQLVTRTGRVYVFDDFAGLAAFQREDRVPTSEVHGVWANLYLHPDQRIDVQQAVFLSIEQAMVEGTERVVISTRRQEDSTAEITVESQPPRPSTKPVRLDTGADPTTPATSVPTPWFPPLPSNSARLGVPAANNAR